MKILREILKAILGAIVIVIFVCAIVIAGDLLTKAFVSPTEADHKYLATEIYKNRQELFVIQTAVAPKQ